MAFSSANAFRDFDRSVRRELRYVREAAQDEFLETVIATSDVRTAVVKAGFILWRAQLGHGWREEQQDGASFEVPAAHPPARMKPIADKATDGRANPRGITCLYLATQKDTAVLEVRPLVGSNVSVAQFNVMRDLRLVNCSGERMGNLARWLRKSWTPEDIEKAIWSDINKAFSELVERGDSSLDYVPTQILAEAFKCHRFGGIAYKSSYGEDGFNVALFDVTEQDNPYFIGKHYAQAAEAETGEPAADRPALQRDDAAQEGAQADSTAPQR